MDSSASEVVVLAGVSNRQMEYLAAQLTGDVTVLSVRRPEMNLTWPPILMPSTTAGLRRVCMDVLVRAVGRNEAFPVTEEAWYVPFKT